MRFEGGRETQESLEEQYNRLLLEGIETNRGYNETGQESEDEDDYERSDRASQLADEMEGQIAERLGILREQGLTNIEAIFPRVHVDANAEEKAREFAEITSEMTRMIMAPDYDPAELNRLRDKARELKSQEKSNELNDEEMEAFDEARKRLAEQEGYEIEGKGAGGWVTLKKGDLEFSMKHFAFPSEFGIGGYSRISKIGVSRKNEKGSESLMYFDRGWDTANEDPEVQKEIDRVLAIFG